MYRMKVFNDQAQVSLKTHVKYQNDPTLAPEGTVVIVMEVIRGVH